MCDFTGSGISTNEIENPKYFPVGSLKKVKLPTGGVVEYNFEANEYAVNNLETEYIPNLGTDQFLNPQFQYLKPVSTINFDTKVSKTYTFTPSSSTVPKAVYIRFTVNEIYPYPPLLDPGDGSQPSLEYAVLGVDYGGSNGILCSDMSEGITTSRFSLGAGNYTIQINGPTGGKGQLEIYEMALKAPPYKNTIVEKGQGIRIKSVQYYDSYASQTPVNSERYLYDDFTDSSRSSGEQIVEGSNMGESIATIVYKNVKVLNGDTNGYTKYYFKAPSSYAKETVPSDYPFWPNVNITKSGLMEKKEIYDSNNRLLTSEQYDYTLQDMDTPKYRPMDNSSYKTKTAWIKEQRNTSKIYDQNGGIITTNSESIKSADQFNLISEKRTHADGTVLETFYQYAKEKNNTALITANMLALPLETQTKRNGTVIAKSEIKYENTAALYPTSVLSYTQDNLGGFYTAIRYDAYNEKGQVIQYTSNIDEVSGLGFPTVIIWGYNKTLPIAKIAGARIQDIGTLADDIIAKSNLDTDETSEKTLIAALDAFRTNPALKNFRITTSTYDPLIGITSVTGPDGMREVYKYDQNNRLQYILDVNGNIVKDYRYNTKL